MQNSQIFNIENIESILNQKKQEYQYIVDSLDFLQNVIPLYINENKNELYISFNGGKDATVVLFLTYIALQRLKKQQIVPQNTILKTVYFVEKNSFPEVDDFIQEIQQLLQFQQVKMERNFKESLQIMIQDYQLQAVVMGNRRDDPYCEKMEHLQASDVDKGYPAFMRINPVIDWKYGQVWKFLRDLSIPYCILYEKGYTYLGNKDNTQQNPHLLIEKDQYKPAYELKQYQYEQASRSQIILSQNDDNSKNSKQETIFIGTFEQFLQAISNNRDLQQQYKNIDSIKFLNNLDQFNIEKYTGNSVFQILGTQKQIFDIKNTKTSFYNNLTKEQQLNTFKFFEI